MKPVINVSFLDVISRYYPNVECAAFGSSYSGIEWHTGNPIPEQELLSKILPYKIEKMVDWVKDEAARVREDASFRVIGTSVPSMIRVYDIKKEQAQRFMVKYDSGNSPEALTYATKSSSLSGTDQDILRERYPLLFEEAEGTGVTLWQQCWAVLDQYRLSGLVLDPILGKIEAIRRAKIAEIESVTTEAELDSITAPVWPDLSSLQEI